jgi:hypothetical protein
MVRLDSWLPDPAVRTHHRGTAAVGADRLWEAAQQVSVRETGPLGRLVRWRIPHTPLDLPFAELFRRYPFTVLDEGRHHLVSGLAGRIWTLDRDYPRLSGPDDFCSWEQGGTVRVAFGHWVEPGSDGEAVLFTEARVQPTDRIGTVRLRALWTVVGRFERLVGAQGVRAAVRRAEQE